MHDSMTSEPAYMSSELINELSGIEEVPSYLASYQHTTGDEQQSWHITPNSIYPSSLGGIAPDPLLSSTRCQWGGLFEELRLATLSPNWPPSIPLPQKVLLFTPLTDYAYSRRKLKKNSPTIAPTMYICVKKYSSASLRDTLLRNYGSST